MICKKTVFLWLLVISSTVAINKKRFPKDFHFATATASYQVEGAVKEDGKGENIWDRACHSVPSPILLNETADIACDSYHKYKEDIEMVAALGTDVYRFSISWSRILPTGYLNNINQAGINYYKNIIHELKVHNVKPMVTMFHWDLPQPIQDIGGVTSEEFVERFLEYAKVLYENLGDDVDYWITFNEPKQTCQGGYGVLAKAPFIASPGIGEYLCTHNVLKAHAAAYHLYDKEFRAKQNGVVGITIDSAWGEPDTDSKEDADAAERFLQFTYGWYANALVHGDYPAVMKHFIAERSAKQGFSKSRLPEFTSDEIDYLNNTVDFLGFNYYTTNMIKHKNDEAKTAISWSDDMEVETYQKDEWPKSASVWLSVVPWGLTKMLHWLKNTYGDIPIVITENGVSDRGGIDDKIRVDYHRDHLSAVRDAIDGGVNVVGYTAWSLMDNFEWTQGYTERFGLFSVDFEDPERKRTPKQSALFYRRFLETRCLAEESECIEDDS